MTSVLFLTGTILMQSIQIQLSKKWKNFSGIFTLFFESWLIFESVEKKMTLIAYVFRKLQTAKDVVRQMSKSNRFTRPSRQTTW